MFVEIEFWSNVMIAHFNSGIKLEIEMYSKCIEVVSPMNDSIYHYPVYGCQQYSSIVDKGLQPMFSVRSERFEPLDRRMSVVVNQYQSVLGIC